MQLTWSIHVIWYDKVWHGMTWYDMVWYGWTRRGLFFWALQPQSSCPNPGQLQPQWKQPSRQGSPGDAQGPGFIDLSSVDSSQYLWVSKGGPSQLIVAQIPWPSSTESTEYNRYNRILRKICESRVDIDEQMMNNWWTDIIRYPALIMYVLLKSWFVPRQDQAISQPDLWNDAGLGKWEECWKVLVE